MAADAMPNDHRSLNMTPRDVPVCACHHPEYDGAHCVMCLQGDDA